MLHTRHYLTSPSEILDYIKDVNCTDYTYVILGRSGPTGKTWLRTKLVEAGYNAVELSYEDIIGLVEYKDNKNHFIVNRMQKMVLIVLNHSIREGKTQHREERNWDEWKNELPSKFRAHEREDKT